MGLMKGWPWGSGSHTNTVVAILHWKGGMALSPEKLGKMEYSVHSRPLFTKFTQFKALWTMLGKLLLDRCYCSLIYLYKQLKGQF